MGKPFPALVLTMLTMMLAAAWAILLAMTAWYLLTREPAAAAGPPPDPHAATVAEFRRLLHDWDRGGADA